MANRHGGARAGAGCPPRQTERSTEQIRFRATPSELEAVVAAAKAAGLNPSDYCRSKVFGKQAVRRKK